MGRRPFGREVQRALEMADALPQVGEHFVRTRPVAVGFAATVEGPLDRVLRNRQEFLRTLLRLEPAAQLLGLQGEGQGVHSPQNEVPLVVVGVLGDPALEVRDHALDRPGGRRHVLRGRRAAERRREQEAGGSDGEKEGESTPGELRHGAGGWDGSVKVDEERRGTATGLEIYGVEILQSAFPPIRTNR